MTPIPVSIIVVSRNRPDALIRCLTGISQLRYAPFEIVVVADPAGLDAVRRWPPGAGIRTILFDEANMSVARNIGLQAAAGEVVAFIDDDAVPEPGWLAHLADAFRDPSVGIAGGFVRGRDGISWHRRARSVDLAGKTHDLEVDGEQPIVLTPSPGRAVKTEGTNMAMRRSAIAAIGGFDPNFRYFLDVTDVNLRMAECGVFTAIVPLAAVHHGFHRNAVRRTDRTPLDLTEFGASWAVFLARYCPDALVAQRWQELLSANKTRLIRHMVDGVLEPRDVRRLMRRLREGFRAGQERTSSKLAPLGSSTETFNAFPSQPSRESKTLAGGVWSRGNLHRKAEEIARAGHITSVFVFSPTSLYHRRWYRSEGYWEQSGGLLGKSVRTDPVFRFWRFRKRVEREAALWAPYR